MTNLVFNQPLPAPTGNFALTLQAGDNAVLMPDASINLSGAVNVQKSGIFMAGFNNLHVASTIYAQNFGILGQGGPCNVILTASAVLEAQGAQAVAILLDSSSSIFNAGLITSSKGAIQMLTHGSLLLNNSGIITAQFLFTDAGDDPSNSLRLVNTGSIVVGSQIFTTVGADEIINSGLIQRNGSGNALHLNDGNDIYRGEAGTVIGDIRLGNGDDSAYGGAGSETFSGDGGDDYIDGGGGVDTALFSGNTPITVDLRLTTSQQTGAGLDRLLNIENITSLGSDDILIGNDVDNVLKSQGGSDTLEGGGGDDTLDGGTTFLDLNTARYTGSAAATVNLLLQGQKQNTGGYGFDTLIGINALEGGSGNDVFTGDGNANRLVGNGGNDILAGGLGDDTLDGGSGRNTAVFAGNRGDYDIHTNGNDHATVTGGDGQDVLTNIRILKFDDQTLVLNADPDAPSVSNVTIAENTLVSTIVASLSAHDADGDAVSYSLLADGGGSFRIDGDNLVLLKALDFETAQQQTITVLATDSFGGKSVRTVSLAVANVIETDSRIMNGGVGNDSLGGEAGNDVIFGFAGQDDLVGAAGNDKLSGGIGNDVLSGGFGHDIFVFDQRNAKTNGLNRSYNLDRITDFSVPEDTIHLAKGVFGKIAKKGVLASDAFFKGAAAHDSSDRIVYNTKTGALWYDDDGNGRHAAIQIATLGTKLLLTNKDFFVI